MVNAKQTQITQNKIIMDHAIKYTNNKKLLQSLNYIWWYKGVYLSLELVGKSREMMTDAYINTLE